MVNAVEIIEAARGFGAEVMAPNAERWQQAGSVPREFFRDAANAGLCRLRVPRAAGGLALSATDYCAVLSELAQHCLCSTFALVVHNNLAGALAAQASPDLVETWLEPMMNGARIGAFALTEPGAGSDAAALATRAEGDADGWVLNGAKAWISNAVHADLLCVFAQTEPARGARGIASFLVPAAHDGVQRLPAYDLLGGHALGAGGFALRDCRLDGAALLNPPGEAFAAAMRAINVARAGVAAMCGAVLERALREALHYTTVRTAFGQRVADFQGVQWILADCATDLEAARALTARATARIDAGADATVACAHAKKFATRVAFTRVADCMQAMGAAGLLREYPLARHLEAAKIAQYLDGTSEIQNVVIARDLLKPFAASLP